MSKTLTSAKLELYIYGGTAEGLGGKTSPDYTIEKSVISNEKAIVFEVSELIKDYIDIKFDGNYEDIQQTKWVYYKVTRTYSDDSTDDFEQYNLAFRGYGTAEDGINPELSKDFMMSNTVINTLCGEAINVPFYKGDDGVKSAVYTQGATELANVAASSLSPYFISTTETRLNSLEDVKVDRTADLQSNSNNNASGELAPNNTTKVEFTMPDGTVKSVLINCIEGCDYKSTPHKISFLNRFGVIQDMWFFARRKDTVNSTRESYKKTILNIGDTGASYNMSDHQNVYLENQGTSVVTMNTGFIHASYTPVLEELMVSEFVYIHDRFSSSPTNAGYDAAVPVKVITGSLELKSKRHDKLISYEVQFEMDSNIIQSVR